MSYKLTLTLDERKAIDWIGHRYTTGHETYRILVHYMPPVHYWDSDDTITFKLPEYVAWELKDLWESEDSLFPCFAPEFKEKLLQFMDSIV